MTQEDVVPGLDRSSLPEDFATAMVVLDGFCAASGEDMYPVATFLDAPYLHVSLEGTDLHQSWGRSGQGLDALQFLLNLIVSRKVSGDVRIMLDAAGYRARREEQLRTLALEIAAEVKSRNEECEIEPLPAHERRLIHAVLAEDPDIITHSEGKEPHRFIVVGPRIAAS